MTTILLTGGTGTLGRMIVPLLREDCGKIRVLSRQLHAATPGVEHVRGDLATDTGTAAAVAGADVIGHCAGSSKGDSEKTRNHDPRAGPGCVSSPSRRGKWRTGWPS